MRDFGKIGHYLFRPWEHTLGCLVFQINLAQIMPIN